MSWISGDWPELGIVAGKGALMYVTALVGLRLGERRTLAQWSIIDFVTAVGIGAIVGRTAVAGSQSFVTGAVALVTLIVVHRLASVARFNAVFSTLVEHRVRVLVEHGRINRGQLRRGGLTDDDLFAQLRQAGVHHLEDIRYVLYEASGGLTIVREDTDPDSELVEAGLKGAVGLSAHRR